MTTNKWHNKHYRGSYFENVTSKHRVVLGFHFQRLRRLFLPKRIRITQVFISLLTSGVPHNCAASTEQHETKTIHPQPSRLIAVLCSAIRITTLSACNVLYRVEACITTLIWLQPTISQHTIITRIGITPGKTTSKPVEVTFIYFYVYQSFV